MIKLWCWNERNTVTPLFHWHVDTDYKSRRTLSVLFPFNFLVTGWLIVRNLAWQIEYRLYDVGTRQNCEAWRKGYLEGRDGRDEEVANLEAARSKLAESWRHERYRADSLEIELNEWESKYKALIAAMDDSTSVTRIMHESPES